MGVWFQLLRIRGREEAEVTVIKSDSIQLATGISRRLERIKPGDARGRMFIAHQ
jgi:hypothetical protein